MSTTTAPVPRSTTTARTTARRVRIAVTGATLWVLLPVAWGVAELEAQEFGTFSFAAVAAAYWLFAVLPPVLLVAGHLALRDVLGERLGRVGATGVVVAGTGLAAMTAGNGVEVASMTAGGGEVAAGHAIFSIGFLVATVGGVLVGSTVIRRRRDGRSRTAGWLLVLALPLGMGIGLLGSLVTPENDAAFWAAIAVPTGLAWLVLAPTLTAGEAGTEPPAVPTA